MSIIKGQISAIERKLLEIMGKFGEISITPEGIEPEDVDKIGVQAYSLLVITEGYKKRFMDWQDEVRRHLDMVIIPRQWDPERLLKEERQMLREEIEKYSEVDEKTKQKMTRLAELRNHSEYEAMSSFVTRKRVQDRTRPLPR